jgi:hypothetical protein
MFTNVFLKIVPSMLVMENTVQLDRPQMTIKYGACALYAGYLRLQAHSEYVILTVFPLQQ